MPSGMQIGVRHDPAHREVYRRAILAAVHDLQRAVGAAGIRLVATLVLLLIVARERAWTSSMMSYRPGGESDRTERLAHRAPPRRTSMPSGAFITRQNDAVEALSDALR